MADILWTFLTCELLHSCFLCIIYSGLKDTHENELWISVQELKKNEALKPIQAKANTLKEGFSPHLHHCGAFVEEWVSEELRVHRMRSGLGSHHTGA